MQPVEVAVQLRRTFQLRPGNSTTRTVRSLKPPVGLVATDANHTGRIEIAELESFLLLAEPDDDVMDSGEVFPGRAGSRLEYDLADEILRAEDLVH